MWLTVYWCLGVWRTCAASKETTAKAWSEFETELGRWEAILGRTQHVAGATFTLADVAFSAPPPFSSHPTQMTDCRGTLALPRSA